MYNFLPVVLLECTRKLNPLAFSLMLHWTALQLDQSRPVVQIYTLSHSISHSDSTTYWMPIVQ